MFAQKMIDEGRLGRVLSVTILAPHRLNLPSRDAWFFDPAQNGDILNDIGSHQYEQFLSYTGAHSARVVASRVANFNLPQHPGFTDFGDCLLEADNGAAGYCRLDWFTPDGRMPGGRPCVPGGDEGHAGNPQIPRPGRIHGRGTMCS